MPASNQGYISPEAQNARNRYNSAEIARQRNAKTALGLILPLGLGANGYFDVAYDVLTQTKSNLTNLILTKKGERVAQPTLGCNIHNLVFEQITPDLESNAKGAIEEAVQAWLPFVTINDVQLIKDEDNNRVFVTIVFSLKSGINLTDVIQLRL